MKNLIGVVIVVLGLVTWKSAQAASPKGQTASTRVPAGGALDEEFSAASSQAVAFYLRLPEIAALVAADDRAFPQIIGTGAMKGPNSSKIRFVLALTPRRASRIISTRIPDSLRVLIGTSGSTGSLAFTDATRTGLPAGSFSACFWVPFRGGNKAEPACFKVTTENHKLAMRALVAGLTQKLIPWLHPDGSVSFTENAPENCDGGADDRHHPTGWCPWGAVFDSVKNAEQNSIVDDQFWLPN